MGISLEYNSDFLLKEELNLRLSSFEILDAISLGETAKSFGLERFMPISIEVRLNNWIVYHVSLPGSLPENNNWIERKSRVVLLTHHSTLYERVSAEERSVNWFVENLVSEDEYAIHGGGLPLILKSGEFIGSLLISGLPQVEDHKFGVEVLTEFLCRKVKNFE